jgi:hypothetical protein
MKLITLALLVTATLCGSAQQRFPITPQQIANALLRRGFTVSDTQVSLVAGIVASSPEPELEVDSVQPLGDSAVGQRIRAKVRVVCPQHHSCLPFYVIVTWPPGTVRSELPTLDRIAGVPPPTPPVSMRAGSNAMLIVDTAQMHLRVPVISLQNGAIGSTIHVTSADRKQTYTAVVVSPTLLTGSL